ncbi:MAG: hypothetical protein HY514_02305 [Candidatus Aenigmarchaeota archaeon]|nr:hypothetical protein [Candidatus Aenigmarchaeota archaeon]
MKYTLLLDFDECLARQNRAAGIARVKAMLKEIAGPKAEEAGNDFGQIYHDMDSILHDNKEPGLLLLKNRINSYTVKLPKELKSQKIDFMWSRELWLKHVSDKHGLNIDNKTIISIIEGYWNAIASSSPLYPQARKYLEKLDKSKVFIVTGSDKTLVADGKGFAYDSSMAEKRKISRIVKQGITMLPKTHIITGDPHDKPSDEFWKTAMKRAGLKEPAEGIIVEDSLSIVLSAMKFGFKGYLLDRHKFYDRKDAEKQVDGYITELNQLPI